MVRAPCCEKMGLKKGPWTPEEDQILINYIQQYGHGNWRALPKHAGLLRCGKSCRLRWTNYLRPDIKRGNFTREEEDTIIKLHEMLGNRWSAIATRLPGRTDNEKKNVWHTHLKKRLKQNPVGIPEIKRRSIDMISRVDQESKTEPELVNLSNLVGFESREGIEYRPISPQQCSSSEISSVTTGDDAINNMSSMKVEPSDDFLEMDENFWWSLRKRKELVLMDFVLIIGCGAMTHDAKSCMKRPRKVGAKRTNKHIAPDENIESFELDYDGKRDRWNGYDTSNYARVVERHETRDAARRKHLKEQQLKKLEEKNSKRNDEALASDEKIKPKLARPI
ncbi:hypothetical protein GH714_030643 [Hevea brasiliensis]|uniref:Uncharacterized protein n=1 Tax=Hevea brasiliensis TaxID=3981 RepID=A0A6A6NDR1_HEVBR|nr:hypothetical protein GH714_030643 [Hevea brasiliensis]